MIKEEYLEDAAAAPPQPMEGLHEIGPAPFLTKTYEVVDDLGTDGIVSWSIEGESFVVWDPQAFSATLLPRYFKHSNFSSFVRQLNTYGFRKIDPDKWEFANELFHRGQKHLLRNIRRRKATLHHLPSQTYHHGLQLQHHDIEPCVELGRFGLDSEVDSLKRDKHVLMMELVKLRQQQQRTRAYLQQMELRLQGTERKQQQMMSFMARAMQNPDFIRQLVQQKERRNEIEDAMIKKRRRPIEAGESSRSIDYIKTEPLEYREVSELEALALEMQGFGRIRRKQDDDTNATEELEQLEGYDKELDEWFWQELVNEGFDLQVEARTGDLQNREEENVNMLAERLGFLGSSPRKRGNK